MPASFPCLVFSVIIAAFVFIAFPSDVAPCSTYVTESFRGNNIISRQNLPKDKSWSTFIDNNTKLPPGKLTMFHFYVNSHNHTAENIDLKLQIWRPSGEKGAFTLVWNKDEILITGHNFNTIRGIDVSRNSFCVEQGDRLGWSTDAETYVLYTTEDSTHETLSYDGEVDINNVYNFAKQNKIMASIGTTVFISEANKVCDDRYKFNPPLCDKVCHCHHRDKICDSMQGSCPYGCAQGWGGSDCQTVCSEGTYGTNCARQCGHCLQGSCNITDGTCDGGCQAGWRGDKCQDACSSGMYGVNCQSECGHCLQGECNNKNGFCLSGCEDGWQGEKCDQGGQVCDPDPLITNVPAGVVIEGFSLTTQSFKWSCGGGYVQLSFPLEVVCNKSGWNPSLDSVKCQPLQCSSLPSEPNKVTVTSPASTIPDIPLDTGTVIQYMCNEANGYVVKGTKSGSGAADITCVATGTTTVEWSPQPWDCEVADCGIPPSPSVSVRLTANPSSTTFGSEAVYECNDNYKTTTPADLTIKCAITGWGNAPTCQLITCDSIDTALGLDTTKMAVGSYSGQDSSGNNVIGTTVTLDCNVGLKPVDPITFTCQTSGTWQGTAGETSHTCTDLLQSEPTLPEETEMPSRSTTKPSKKPETSTTGKYDTSTAKTSNQPGTSEVRDPSSQGSTGSLTMSSGLIVGIVVGASIAVIIIISLMIVVIQLKKNAAKSQKQDPKDLGEYVEMGITRPQPDRPEQGAKEDEDGYTLPQTDIEQEPENVYDMPHDEGDEYLHPLPANTGDEHLYSEIKPEQEANSEREMWERDAEGKKAREMRVRDAEGNKVREMRERDAEPESVAA